MESILPLLEQTQKAAASVRNLTGQQRSELLLNIAAQVQANVANIIAANQKDLDVMDDADPKKDRLLLNEQRIQALAQSGLRAHRDAANPPKMLSAQSAQRMLTALHR